ncbi:hypothetical protein Dimus_022509 [Dionaea muscipula]
MIAVDDGGDVDNDEDDGNDFQRHDADYNVHATSINATEVIADEDEHDDDAVELACNEIVDVARHDNDDDGEEDNMPPSSRIKAFRRGYAVDEDDVVLSLKYQAPQQGLINVDADLEVVCANTAEMEV